ncbi:MAG: hypothetical protein IJ252_08580 [Solobacterium sp.]|nr:hypothetical protein [Solobacterium sp.]
MALRKHAHQLFTDREEPRQAFWNTLRKAEENPGFLKILNGESETSIPKVWRVSLKTASSSGETMSRFSAILNIHGLKRGIVLLAVTGNPEELTDEFSYYPARRQWAEAHSSPVERGIQGFIDKTIL